MYISLLSPYIPSWGEESNNVTRVFYCRFQDLVMTISHCLQGTTNRKELYPNFYCNDIPVKLLSSTCGKKEEYLIFYEQVQMLEAPEQRRVVTCPMSDDHITLFQRQLSSLFSSQILRSTRFYLSLPFSFCACKICFLINISIPVEFACPIHIKAMGV